ncbi:MAG TPA: hypothetical protein VNH44_07015 [Micropepsaceae bacterium]|nr:hypothetical protein [Micropepsaceae bacterium]
MIPYTRDAIAQLREAARKSTPHNAIIAQFGWSAGMLDRVCRDHGIRIAPPATTNAQAPGKVPPITLPQGELEQFIAGLPRRQAVALRTLRAASLVCDGYIPSNAIMSGEMRDTSTRNVGKVIGFLRIKLADAGLPYFIQSDSKGGYRLLFTGKS